MFDWKSLLKKIFTAVIPAIILAGVFYFLIGLTGGAENIESTSSTWFWVGSVLFIVILVFLNEGQLMIGRALKYLAYEFWLSPIIMTFYSLFSTGQAVDEAGKTGETAAQVGAAIGAGIGSAMLIGLSVVIGGFGGLIFFLIGNSIVKKGVGKKEESSNP